MKSDNLLVVIAVVAVVISVVGLFTTYSSISSLKQKFTGYFASNEAYLNLTVESTTQINFSYGMYNISFGSGRVDIGNTSAVLDTSQNQVSGGNWTAFNRGFILQNIGNVNVSINLSGGKNAASLIGGTGPQYWFNVSESPAAVAGGNWSACSNSTNIWNKSQWYNMTVSPGLLVCDSLKSGVNNNSIRIDLRLVIPENSIKGLLSDVITATSAVV